VCASGFRFVASKTTTKKKKSVSDLTHQSGGRVLMKLKTLTLVGGILLSASAFAADAPKEKPAVLSNSTHSMIAGTCAGCHGYEGKSVGAAPSLAGLEASYIESAMHAFKKGERPATIMNRIAKAYSDADIKAMAAYFASKK
jgi:sulfide dehydrogenase cytochrome subunit